ncbi:MAG: VWA domain-containing protein [Acidobacteriota bacterium]
MNIEFTNLSALGLLILILAAIYLARTGLANLSRARSAVSITVRALILLALVLALAGLRLRLETRDLAVIFLVDVSASVDREEQSRALEIINREIEGASPRDFIGVVAFAREPSVELAPMRKESLGERRITEINSNPPRDYTDIASALRLAAALVPESAAGRMVLLSDGNENLENASQEAQILRAEGIEVYAHSLSTVSEQRGQFEEVAVRDLVAPETSAEGETFDLKVSIDSTINTDARLRVFRNDSLVSERSVSLTASGENIFVLPQRNDEKGFYTYRAEVEALQSDSFAQNNSREAFTIVQGKPKTLYLYGDPAPSPAITRVLADGNFAATVRSAEAMPTTLAGFQDYDLVIFDNVPAVALTKNQMKMVQSYVRDLGGGFFMIGGDQSFGPGGYYKTPVEETLPVSLDVRQKKHFPSLAIALVIDKSGSMSGMKMELALEAASATVEFLSERDSVGVVAFDSEAMGVISLTKVENKQAITDRIRSIQASGGTNMYPGIRMAYEWLQSSDAQLKHIIVLSDGQSEEGDFRGIAQAARNAGMTLSSVAIGEDADHQTMKFIADTGGGRFYATNEAESLPRIFTREAFLASRATIIEEPFVPRHIRPTQATSGVDWNSAPMLGGYVGVAERDSVNSPAITALISDKDDPVYAEWQYGLGRAGAFTSDAKPRWAAGWMNWPGFGQFWTQAFRDVLRREGASDLASRVEIDSGRGRITVEAIGADGRFRNNLRLSAHIVAPDLSTSDITLDQTAAGRYEANFAATSRGAYLVSVIEEGGEMQSTGAVNSYSPEFIIASSDANLLANMSETTGGKMLSGTEASDLFERRRTRTRPREVWGTLVLIALLLLPVDVGVRRLHITREQIEHVRAWIRAKLRRREAQEEAVASLEQLKASRSRVRLSDARVEEEAAKKSTMQAVEPRVEKVSKPAREIEPESAATEGPLASRLLEARRRKRE